MISSGVMRSDIVVFFVCKEVLDKPTLTEECFVAKNTSKPVLLVILEKGLEMYLDLFPPGKKIDFTDFKMNIGHEEWITILCNNITSWLEEGESNSQNYIGMRTPESKGAAEICQVVSYSVREVVDAIGGTMQGPKVNLDESEKIATGSCGVVYRGNLKDGSDVAVKVLKVDRSMIDTSALSQLVREARILKVVRSPFFVQMLGFCNLLESDSSTSQPQSEFRAIIYRFYENGSLHYQLFGNSFRVIGSEIRLQIAVQAARGLLDLHELGVYHLDFKPANILLDSSMHVKIGDFGLAKVVGHVKNEELAGAISRTRPNAVGTGRTSNQL
eukprot:765917-Hanusia_phi.AAC.1